MRGAVENYRGFFKKIFSSYRRSATLLVAGVFFIGLLCYESANFLTKQKNNRDKTIFNKNALLISDKIESFVNGLQGMGGVFLIKNFNPTPSEVRQYVQFRNSFTNFPGALGFGFIRYVKKTEEQSYLRKVRKYVPDFQIKKLSDNKNDDLFIIELIEPFENNRAARGLDTGSENNRRQAATLAMETGKPVLTGSITLVQASSEGPGFLFYYPIYEGGLTPSTIKERREKIRGWSYAPITLSSLLVPFERFIENEFDYEFYDVTEATKPALLYISSKGELNDFESRFSVGERSFLLKGSRKHKSFANLYEIVSFVSFIILSSLYVFFFFRLRNFINEKSKFEERAFQAETWSSSILNNSSFSIVSTNPEGIISTFNKTAENLLGYQADELINQSTPALFHDFDEVVNRAKLLSLKLGREIKPSFDLFQAIAETNEFNSLDWIYIRKDGSQFPVRLTISAIRGLSDQIIGYVGVAEDISIQKAMAEKIEDQKIQLIQSAKMTSLGEMAGGVAHEINTPLTIILNKARSLANYVKEDQVDREKMIEDLEKINKTALKISKIINGLKTFSRKSENDEMTKVNLRQIVDDTLELCNERFKFYQTELKVSGNLNCDICCRPAQISQVLLNLLNNSFDAIEHLPERWIEISGKVEDNRVRIVIRDSGHGIPEEVSQKLTQPFFTTKEIGKGIGLGLSISNGIIKDHQGELYYDRADSHTSFIIELPLA